MFLSGRNCCTARSGRPLIVITGRHSAVEYQSGVLPANHDLYYPINFTGLDFSVRSENVYTLCQCATLPQQEVCGGGGHGSTAPRFLDVTYWTLRLSDWQLCLVFRMFWFWILNRRSGYPDSFVCFQTSCRQALCLKIGHAHFIPHNFQITSFPTIQSYTDLTYKVDKNRMAVFWVVAPCSLV
jgi:hypothetical protein